MPPIGWFGGVVINDIKSKIQINMGSKRLSGKLTNG